MSPATLKLCRKLIQLARTALNALSDWLDENETPKPP
jgi:hypothetical protein